MERLLDSDTLVVGSLVEIDGHPVRVKEAVRVSTFAGKVVVESDSVRPSLRELRQRAAEERAARR